MDLLSGVVRNRKTVHIATAREIAMSFDGSEIGEPQTTWARIWMYLSGSALLRNFNLRVHKFIFQWDLVIHMAICIVSLAPFMVTGSRLYSVVPISVWAFYNILFLIGTRRASLVIPNFGRLKHSFKALMEEFFSPKLLPVLSISFLLVALSLSVTGRRLGGPPLCYSTCRKCLASWDNALPIDLAQGLPLEPDRASCGYSNGRELMGYYTMAQTSFVLFLTVIIAMAVCMAWKVADDELAEREAAEEWLKREDPMAFLLRDELIKRFGPPASPIRPEGNAVWVAFGIVAALTFTLLGWHNWYVLPPSPTATMLIVLNLLTILMSSLILHLGFFGRILSLYKRNYMRVAYLTKRLDEMGELQVDAWWNCRSFVLNDDLALDYDIGGLAVSTTFVINLLVFLVLLGYTWQDGFGAMMEPPGSYCAYACLYITMCLIKIFTLATNTFEEQHRHITGLQNLSINLLHRGAGGMASSVSNVSLDVAWEGEAGVGATHSLVALQAIGLGASDSSMGLSVGRTPSQDVSGCSDDGLIVDGLVVDDGGEDFSFGPLSTDRSSPRSHSSDSSRNRSRGAAATAAMAAERDYGGPSTPLKPGHTGLRSMLMAMGLVVPAPVVAISASAAPQVSLSSSSRDARDREHAPLTVSSLASHSSGGGAGGAGGGGAGGSGGSVGGVGGGGGSGGVSSISGSIGLCVPTSNHSSGLRNPTLTRNVSVVGNLESKRQTLAEMVSQIRCAGCHLVVLLFLRHLTLNLSLTYSCDISSATSPPPNHTCNPSQKVRSLSVHLGHPRHARALRHEQILHLRVLHAHRLTHHGLGHAPALVGPGL